MSEKTLKILCIVFSIAIPAIVSTLLGVPTPNATLPFDLYLLPKLNAIFKGCAAIMLVVGFLFIKQKKIKQHKISMVTAFAFSTLFLVSYVLYHLFSAEETSFGGEGAVKVFYLFVLLTHIVLASIMMPFVLFTFFNIITNSVEKHRKLAKIILPIWLYVSITGVVVYLMISPYY